LANEVSQRRKAAEELQNLLHLSDEATIRLILRWDSRTLRKLLESTKQVLTEN